MKKKIIKIGVTFLCAIVLLASLLQIYRINAAYPEAKTVMVPLETEDSLQDGVLMSVQSVKWLNNDDMETIYGDYIDLFAETKVVIATVKIQNTTKEEKTIPLYTIYVESDTHYSNGLDMEMFLVDNPSQSGEVTLKAEEAITVALDYSMFDIQFQKNVWEQLENKQFYLVNERYPVKNCWLLQ